MKSRVMSWMEKRQPRLRTWGQFEDEILPRFAAVGSRALVSEEIRRRTQGEQESVVDFFACLYALFCLADPPWTEAEKVDRAHQNVLPKMQMWIPRRQVSTLYELERRALQVEEDLTLASQYRTPPPLGKTVFSEWAYRPPTGAARSHTTVGRKESRGRAEGEGNYGESNDARGSTECLTKEDQRWKPTARERGGALSPFTGRAGLQGDPTEPMKGRGARELPERCAERPRWRPRPSEETAFTCNPIRSPTRRGRTGPQRGVCWRCGLTGHYARTCPEPPTRSGVPGKDHRCSCGKSRRGNDQGRSLVATSEVAPLRDLGNQRQDKPDYGRAVRRGRTENRDAMA